MSEPNPIEVPFEPLLPLYARLVAYQVAEWCAHNAAAPAWGRCVICNAKPEARVEIDAALLAGAPMNVLREITKRAMNNPWVKQWPPSRYIIHRDQHLVPLVNGEIRPALARAASIPLPKNGPAEDRDWWFILQINAVREEAMQRKDLRTVLVALRHMREIDLDRRRGEQHDGLPPHQQTVLEAQADARIRKMETATGDKLDRAFSLSVRAQEDENGETDGAKSEAGTGDDGATPAGCDE